VCTAGIKNQYLVLCWFWKNGLTCPHAKCTFAHGVDKLRPATVHPKLKTCGCQNFYGEDCLCKYGKRCSFQHADVENYIGKVFSSDMHKVTIDTKPLSVFKKYCRTETKQ
jgi:hypothetical protein